GGGSLAVAADMASRARALSGGLLQVEETTMKRMLRRSWICLCAVMALATAAHAQAPGDTPPGAGDSAGRRDTAAPAATDAPERRDPADTSPSPPVTVLAPSNPAATTIQVGTGDLGRALPLQ